MRLLKEVLVGPAFIRIVFNLGVLSGVLALVDFVLSVLYVNDCRAAGLDNYDHVARAFQALYLTSSYLSIMQFTSCALFVYGSLMNKPRWYLPWLAVYTASFLLYLGVFCGAAATMYLGGQAPTGFEVLLRCLISGVLNTYFLLLCFCVLPRVDSTDSKVEPAVQKTYYDCMLANA